MQSLQMRWPVPGHIGLSIITSASAPMASPRLRSRCISEIFSSSGQPASGDAERVGDDRALLVGDALAAAVLVALVAEHAVVDLAQPLAHPGARIGQREAVAAAARGLGPDQRLRTRRIGPDDVDQVLVVERLGEAEHDPRRQRRVVDVGGAPAPQRVDLDADRGLGRLVAGGAGGLLAVEQRAAGPGQPQLADRQVGGAADGALDVGVIGLAGGRPPAPPFSSGRARRRTKSTLKRNRSS